MTDHVEAPRCPIRGHDHQVQHVKKLTQERSGVTADIWECPGGSYRWFLLRGERNLLAYGVRMTRPRYGWKKDR